MSNAMSNPLSSAMSNASYRCLALLVTLALGCQAENTPSESSEVPPSAPVASVAMADPGPAAASASAGMTFTHFLAGMPLDVMIAESRYDVIVATVGQMLNQQTTNANPPRVTLTVHEVLQGDFAPGKITGMFLPFPHDVDYGDPETNPRVIAWKRTPLQAPPAGTKLILLGELTTQGEEEQAKQKVFAVSAVGQFPFSNANRQLAVQGLEKRRQKIAAREREQQAAQAEFQRKMQQHRSQFSDEDLRELATTADFVAIGTVVSGGYVGTNPRTFDFLLSKIFKGTRRRKFNADQYIVGVNVPKDLAELLDARDRPYLLFLSEEEIDQAPARDVYDPLRERQAVVEADAAAIQIVEETLSQKP